MRLLKLEIAGFGRLRDRVIEFAPGLQIIWGPNESGKSTLVQAVLAGLYGFDQRRRPEREARRLYAPWAGPYALDLWVADDAGHVYCLRRDFARQEQRCYRQQDGQMVPVAFPEVFGDVALVNQSLGRSTLVVTQQEITSLDEGGLARAVSSRLSHGGGEVPVSEALAALERLRRELGRQAQSAAASGALQQVQEALARTDSRLRELQAEVERYRADFDTLQQLEEDIAEKERYLATYRPLVEQYAQYRAALADRERITAEHLRLVARVSELEKHEQRARELEERVAALGRPEKFGRENLDRLARLSAQAGEAAAAAGLAGIEERGAQVYRERRRAAAGLGRGRKWLVAGLLLAGAGLWLVVAVNPVAGALVLAGGAMLAAVGWKGIRAWQGRDNLLLAAQQREEELVEFLHGLGCRSVKEWQEVWEQYQVASRALEEARIRREAVAEGRLLAAWQAELHRVTAERLTVEAAVEQYRPPVAEETIWEVTRRLPEVEVALAAARLEQARLQERLRQAPAREDELYSLRAERERLAGHLADLQARYQGVILAVGIIQQAFGRVQGEFQPALRRRMGEMLAWITGERYREVQVILGPGELSLEIKAPETGGRVLPESLSTATQDLVYLAARLALGEYLTGTSSFPLILDDPLVNFDRPRLERMVDFLRELGQQQQVIWLAKDRMWEELPALQAIPVIELPGPGS